MSNLIILQWGNMSFEFNVILYFNRELKNIFCLLNEKKICIVLSFKTIKIPI